MTLGAYGVLTGDAARALAATKLADIAEGDDPQDAREKRSAMPTFGEWRDTYLEGVRRRKKQPRHDERYLSPPAEAKKRGRIRVPDHPVARIAQEWRTRPLDHVARRDVTAAMEAIAQSGNTTANPWLASVRACFAQAVRDGVIGENPAMGVRQFREAPPRARVLSDDALGRVVAAFDALTDPHVRAAFVLLMDGGARKFEVLGAKWADIDQDGGLWRIPSPKSGRPQVILLSVGTVGFLRAVPRLGPWLIPGRDSAEHRTDLRNGWRAVRESAELDGVTIHDLRRTFGLHVARKAGLHVASKLLRHSDIRVTERVYARLGIDDLLLAVVDMQGERGKVIALARRKAN